MKTFVITCILLSLSVPCLALELKPEQQLCVSKGEIAQYVMSNRQIGTPKEEMLAKIREAGNTDQQELAALEQVVDLIYETPIYEDAFERLKATQEIKIGVYNSCIQKILPKEK